MSRTIGQEITEPFAHDMTRASDLKVTQSLPTLIRYTSYVSVISCISFLTFVNFGWNCCELIDHNPPGSLCTKCKHFIRYQACSKSKLNITSKYFLLGTSCRAHYCLWEQVKCFNFTNYHLVGNNEMSSTKIFITSTMLHKGEFKIVRVHKYFNNINFMWKLWSHNFLRFYLMWIFYLRKT